MKKIICLLLIIFLLLTSCGVEKETELKIEIVSQETLHMYNDVDTYEHDMEITKFNLYDNVSYVEASEFIDKYILIARKALLSSDMFADCYYEGDIFKASRENGETLEIDPNTDTLKFSSYAGFISSAYCRQGEFLYDYGDEVKDYYSEDLLMVGKGLTAYSIRTKEYTILDLSEYHIDIIFFENKVYVPFQVMSNLLLASTYNTYVCFDDGLFLTPEMIGTEEYVDFYSSRSLNITEDLLEFNYWETCFFLDTQYSLMEDTFNMSFDELFIANGLKEEALKSTKGYDEMINFATDRIIDDGHTGLWQESPYTEGFLDLTCGRSYRLLIENRDKYYNGRTKILGSNVLMYQEIENTAFITFDQFNSLYTETYEKGIPSSLEEVTNPTELLVYSYAQITREDSPIDNIVIDISCNPGGDTRFLTYALGFFMDEVTICFKDNIDKSINFSTYQSDCNLDHVIDEKDKLLINKNLFVIESEFTYSCGNIFCHVMDEAGAITLGARSGGGSCCVVYALSSVGTAYQISGNLKMMSYRNGIYEPNDNNSIIDYSLTVDQMYNRVELTKLVNSLVK